MKNIFLFILLFHTIGIYSQRYDQKWILGYDAVAGQPYGISELNFTNNSLNIAWQNYPINFGTTQTSMYNETGNMLFCTNGVYVYNSNYDTMKNTIGFNPSPYTSSHIQYGLYIPQGVLAIPSPKQDNTYYLFHETVKWTDTTGLTPLELYYSMIDMNGDNGKGEVKAKNIIIIQDTLIQGQLTACKHANGRDWWIVAPAYFGDGYYRCLLTPEGVQNPIFQTTNAVHIRSSYLG